jgi:cell division protein FtsQ
MRPMELTPIDLSLERPSDPPTARRRRRRFTLWALTLAALAGTAVGIYLCVREEPVFPLEEVILAGRTRLSPDEALALAGLRRGMNLLDVDLARACALLEALPFVRRARVELRLPDAVRIEVIERQPALWVALGLVYVADEEGVIFRRVLSGERPELPVLTGLTRNDVRQRAPFVAARVREARALYEALGTRCLEEIGYHPVRGYHVRLCEGPEVRLGLPPFEPKLARLGPALRKAGRGRIIYLDDERRPERVVVRIARENG